MARLLQHEKRDAQDITVFTSARYADGVPLTRWSERSRPLPPMTTREMSPSARSRYVRRQDDDRAACREARNAPTRVAPLIVETVNGSSSSTRRDRQQRPRSSASRAASPRNETRGVARSARFAASRRWGRDRGATAMESREKVQVLPRRNSGYRRSVGEHATVRGCRSFSPRTELAVHDRRCSRLRAWRPCQATSTPCSVRTEDSDDFAAERSRD